MVRIAWILPLLMAACSPQAESPPSENHTAGTATAPSASTAPQATRKEAATLHRYTLLADCALVSSTPDEAGSSEHECRGEGGYRLRLTESDLRQNVIVIPPGGGERSLALPDLANGAFSSVGGTIEWRGEMADGAFAPHALILRHSVMEDPDPMVPEVSYLVVAQLIPRVCVVARVPPAPGQNIRARELADAGGACLDRSALDTSA